eukprot:CAMPEP_0201723596 /NCGR_PEP_ID=MMETSP0593-20130828/7597_1 /ASSEMBLY_ACC=CAM_ASM_000672 /TAXON_ID=267983 /ORGANISM="Skeletonema japonicum, Strain CCMP2506" /LENGTH=796 /DNA_ID=CAMNT_0048214725 /DNA_START=132 /DNA_END=2522 /DNA_ORIENTATION=+
MFDEAKRYQNSGSSLVPLHVRNNETVASGVTEVTYDSAHTSLAAPSSLISLASTSSRGSGFRSVGGGGMNLTLDGIQEGDEQESLADDNYPHSSEASMRSSVLNNNSVRGSVVSASSASYYSQQQQEQQRRLNSSLRNSGNASLISSATSSSRRRYRQSDASTIQSSLINSLIQSNRQQQQQVIDNQRLISHNPKAATQEVNVSEYQEAIPNSDEMSSLPDEYYDDDSYTQRRRKAASDATVTTTTGGDSLNQDTEVELLSTQDTHYKSPLSLRRRWYSLVSVLAAFALAAVGLKVSADSLSTTTALLPPTTSNRASSPSSSHASDYLPGYQFGGGLGGLTAGQEQERRMTLAYNQYGIQPPQQQSSSSQLRRPNGRESVAGVSRGGRTVNYNKQAPIDPFHGYGPPQFNPEYDSPLQGSIQAGLSSTPLTSYVPPPNNLEDSERSSSSFATSMKPLDPMFHGSMMELSILPYNQFMERPVVWDVPLSGTGSLQTIFGSCLHLVQCNHDYTFNHHNTGSTTKRNLMEVVTRDDVKTVIEQSNTMKMNQQQESNEPQKPLHPQAEEDPALKTGFHRSSTYVNVDCSSPEGVDRGIAHNLAESDLTDVFYSHDPYDVARLFAPPTEVYGRGIVMIRNPIQRAVATYKRLQIKRPDMVKDMTLEQFAASHLLHDNFLTRTLSRNKHAPLTEADIDLAKEVLKRKFVVGLYDHFEDSVRRFEAFFGWKLGEGTNSCQSKAVQQEMNLGYNDFDTLPYDSTYSAIAEKNRADLELFKFAEYLYKYQERALFGNAVDSLVFM